MSALLIPKRFLLSTLLVFLKLVFYYAILSFACQIYLPILIPYTYGLSALVPFILNAMSMIDLTIIFSVISCILVYFHNSYSAMLLLCFLFSSFITRDYQEPELTLGYFMGVYGLTISIGAIALLKLGEKIKSLEAKKVQKQRIQKQKKLEQDRKWHKILNNHNTKDSNQRSKHVFAEVVDQFFPVQY